MQLRRLKDEPKCTKSRTLTDEPKRATPSNEIVLPLLAKLRSAKEEPN
jgi:hypothetical protein